MSPADERPRVVGVDGEVRVAAGGLEDLLDEAGATNGAVGVSSMTDRPNGRHRTTAVTSPARPVVRIRIGRSVRALPGRSRSSSRRRLVGRVAASARRPRPPAGHSARRIVTTATIGMRIAELRLDERGDDREDRGPLRAVAPQLAQAEQQEDDAERVDLAPDDAVEPGDRVERRRRARADAAPARCARRRARGPSTRRASRSPRSARIGGSLIRSPIAAERAGRRARRATGRTGSPACSRGRSRARRSRTRPSLARLSAQNWNDAEVDLEAGAREQVCDDEPEGEPEREDDEDRADGVPRPGRPRRRVACLGSGPPDAGPVTGRSAPARAWKVDRSVAQGRPDGPRGRDPTDRAARPRSPLAGDRRRRSLLVAGSRWPSTRVTARRPLLRPLRVAGRGLPRGPGGDPLPGRGDRRTRSATPSSRTSCRSPTTDGVAARAAPVPAAAGRRPRAVRGGVGPRDRRPGRSSRSSARSTSAICWWMLGRLPVGAGVRLGDDGLLRLRDGVLVRGPARRRPGTRPTSSRSGWRCSRSASRSARTATRRRRGRAPADDPGGAAGAVAGGASPRPRRVRPRSTGASSWPGSCSGSPAPPA